MESVFSFFVGLWMSVFSFLSFAPPALPPDVALDTGSHPAQQVTADESVVYTSAQLTAVPTTGDAPLMVQFEGRIEVPHNQRGGAIIFFGDGVSDVMFRSGPTLFGEEWSYTYAKSGEYDAVLVLTTESNADLDPEVMKSPTYFKNTVIKQLRISVDEKAAYQCPSRVPAPCPPGKTLTWDTDQNGCRINDRCVAP